ncbi:phenylacetic acid degradation protein PaaY [Klebsiella pneumoniae]|uniref:Phenylacetic acid degradation protein PaaY n=1 Tax=Klebsiella pneumoniae TaxID=573 RepID=A0A377TS90_KLEPN|nr:phenylacetic acid degradation protein PaaY [Klebsiella pneumoniae]
MPIYQIDGLTPVVPEESYVHPTAVLIGDVILGKGVYVGPTPACAATSGASWSKTAPIFRITA